MKDEGAITMVCLAGLFVVGKLYGKTMLKDPRVFAIIENGARIQLSPLPGTPGMITIGDFALMYEIPKEDKNLQELYYRVTHPEEFAEKKTVAIPGVTGNS
jgi:hypothetical protein